MQKQWYEAALAVAILGCGGVSENGGKAQGGATLDAGIPSATGGLPTARYGVLATTATGGRSGIDTGTPKQTGGTPTDVYGVLPIGGRSGGVVAYYGPLIQGGNG